MTVDYVSRTYWGAPAGDPVQSAQFAGPLDTIWVHTGAVRLDSPGDTYEERAHCRSYERTALDRGWTAVGYNVLVGQSGTAYVGRGLDRRSGANKGAHNDNALSVCVIGHGDYEALSPTAQLTLAAVIEDLRARNGNPRVRLLGHREEPTDKSCPGNLLMPWVTGHRDSHNYWTGDDMPTANEIAWEVWSLVTAGEQSTHTLLKSGTAAARNNSATLADVLQRLDDIEARLPPPSEASR